MKKITVKGAREHNLKQIDMEMPRDSLVVITGVSGSGKSSLAFDTVYREGQRRYLSTLSSYARQFMGEVGRASVDRVEGLSPAVSVDQKTVVRNPRSTVGTMSEVNDFLRLLFARLGDGRKGTTSSLFSFNSPSGACPECKGLGVTDRIDQSKLVADPEKTIREGALVITTPTGYLVYSQVTLDVLNQVCNAHDFDVDIPWKDLTDEQLDIVLNGSDRIKIPYGKHPLESRMKWKGITAKPREEGYYKGILPVMDQILKRDRNKNIMRFVTSAGCEACKGSRLRPEALEVSWMGANIAELSAKTVSELGEFISRAHIPSIDLPVAEPLLDQIRNRLDLLEDLGLGYLTLDRDSTGLSGGEAQRIRLANQVSGKLQGVLYVLDEPSVGLHPRDQGRLLNVLARLLANGNSVLIVEHDEETMRSADWLVDLGPGAGVFGGELLFNGTPESLRDLDEQGLERSPTAAHLMGTRRVPVSKMPRPGSGDLVIEGASENNLKNLDVVFKISAFNVVTGVSGAGKTTLVMKTLCRAVRAHFKKGDASPGVHRAIIGMENFDKLIEIDQAPIGRTPRSNPATYTKLFDEIRTVFALEERSVELGFDKGRFSFNVEGGRCEKCEGAGVLQIGMHFLEDVSVLCEECGGRRFNEGTLSVLYRGKTIHQVLEMSVDEAFHFFEERPKAQRILKSLIDVGLGYIGLGQSSTTLSGGEAQRVKLASELARPSTGSTLYVLNEPTTGLHSRDVEVLLSALERLVDAGNTVVAVEHDPSFVLFSDWIVDLGPGSGVDGGCIVISGTPEEVAACESSETGFYLKKAMAENRDFSPISKNVSSAPAESIGLHGVSTNNLKHVDVDIPHGKLSVITGVSGSGKTSLAFDTIYAEGRRRFSESLSTHARRYFKQLPKPPAIDVTGVSPAVAIDQTRSSSNPRSTVATFAEVHELFRLLYARAGTSDAWEGQNPTSDFFSFNHHSGSCERCLGLGTVTMCDPEKLVTEPGQSLLTGAMDGTKTGKFYGEEGGRHTAILEAVGAATGTNFGAPWKDLDKDARALAMYGAGERVFDVVWRFNRKGRKGVHRFESNWPGFTGYVQEEYERVQGDHRGERMADVMREDPCPDCGGARLCSAALSFRFVQMSIAKLCSKSVVEILSFCDRVAQGSFDVALSQKEKAIGRKVLQVVSDRLVPLAEVGLGYLRLDRRISTLSGGEMGRLKLATQLVSGLCRVTYVLDEPTVGLHRRDTEKLLDMLWRLRDEGNTVVVVEHDEDVIRAADHVVDIGPGAGERGGEIVAEGGPEHIAQHPASLTGAYLCGKRKVGIPATRRKTEPGIVVIGAHTNNLKSLNAEIQKGGLVAVTGVSGSGKSSLVFDVIVSSFEQGRPVGCERIEGTHRFGSLVCMDQSPIGRSPSSTPATYVGVFDQIRSLFAASKEAQTLGLKKAAFSFNSKGGRCETCSGMGRVKVEMGFLADVWIECEECHGRRYRALILDVKVGGYSIADVLKMTVDEAAVFLGSMGKSSPPLQVLTEVGLGYLRMGQPGNTLSGGEAQRLKLAAELGRAQKKKKKVEGCSTLYVFDEPTTGLHFEDVSRLVNLFHRLVDEGHTVLVVEHNLDVIKNADSVIDLGLEGGDAGGDIVVQGTVQEVAACEGSWTGKALAEMLRTTR